MKKLPLTNGGFALIDDEDFERLSAYPWRRQPAQRSDIEYAVYTASAGKRTTIRLHRMILGATSGQSVDHRDGNGLNNAKSNLRICTHAENCRNRKTRYDSKTGIKGIKRHISHGKETSQWMARIGVDGNRLYLGLFDSKEAAAIAYQNAAKLYHGEFARFTQPKGEPQWQFEI